MKIALIRQDYHKYGGAERYVYNLSRELAKRGHHIHIFAHTGEEELHQLNNSTTSMNPITFHRVPVLGGAAFLRTLSFAIFCRRLLKKESFDIIHSFDRTLYQDIYRAGDGCHREWLKRSLALTSSPPARLAIRLNLLHLILLFLEREVFKKSKKIIAIAKVGKEEIIKHYGTNPRDITVVYNGVDGEEFKPDNKRRFGVNTRRQSHLAEDDFVILFVGSGFRRKGLSFLIKAVALLKEEKVKLLIVGKDRKRPYSRLVKKLGLEDKVIFTGGSRETYRFYAAATIFVFPTLYEPFGNVCLEALSSGLPLIVSRSSGAAEIITERKEGFLLNNPEDPEEIARKIKMTFDEDLRKRLSRNARCLAEKFTLARNVEETLKVYTEVIRKP
ncbi:MAG: glycosyltransferase family 4 protein [Nitrospirae bacterium]|nr:glycosyltransferase family 4 protein [Nitrospirota bacterium]